MEKIWIRKQAIFLFMAIYFWPFSFALSRPLSNQVLPHLNPGRYLGSNFDSMMGGEPLKFKIPNGMTVILLENHQAPVLAMQVWVNVGSADETEKIAGMAHVHEHMLFKGTKKRGVGEIAKEVENAGGDINAWTSFDQTVYHIVLASRYMETGIEILSDAIRNSQFEAEELNREREVVLEEIRRDFDIPSYLASRESFALAFPTHPYGRPVIGYEKTVSSFTRDQILSFYKKWYVPNNMTFVMVGDFDSKKASAKIRKAFAGFRKGKLPRRSRPQSTAQKNLKAKVLKKNIKEGYFDIAFRIPDIRHKDIPALDLISMILGHGDSSRLTQEIKEKRGLVNNISAFAYTPKDPGVFMIRGTLNQKNIVKALQETVKQVALLNYQPVSAEELRRAKINILSDVVFEKETVEGQARKLGFYQSVLNDLSFEKKYYDDIEGVSARDLQKVANRYLKLSNMSIVTLLPEKNSPMVSSSSLKKIAQEGFRDASKSSKMDQAKSNQVQIYKLKNGIKVIMKENHGVPLISVKAASLGGLRYETPSTNGISSLTARVWTKGTPTLSALDIAKTIESMAGNLEAVSGRNSLGLSMEVLSQFADEGMRLFSEVLRFPVFDPKELETEKRNTLEAIRNLEDRLPSFAFKNFLKILYDQHPYGMHVLGTKETVSGFNREDLKNYYERVIKPDNLVIAIVGDVHPQHMLELLEQELGNWKTTPFNPIQLPAVSPIANKQEEIIFRDKEQAHILFGFLGTTLNSNDRYAMDVLDTVLSGQGGRLFLQLRDRQSLAYALSAYSQEGIEPGCFGVYIGTDPKKVDEALEGIRRELKKVTTEKIPQKELQRALRYIVGSFERNLQRNSAQAADMAYNELYGLGWDESKKYIKRVQKITSAEVLRVAKKYIQLDRPTIVMIRPQEINKNASPKNRQKSRKLKVEEQAQSAY